MMHKKIILLALICFLCFVVNSCVVVTYPIRAKRVDQGLSRGNRGYLTGKTKICEEEPRKTTRQLQVIEIGHPSIGAGTDLSASVSGDEISPSVSVLQDKKQPEEILVVSAPRVEARQELLASVPEPEANPVVSALEGSKESEGAMVVSTPAIKAVDTKLAFQGTKVAFGFTERTPTWEIPDWCYDKEDFVGKKLTISRRYSSEGISSLELIVDFPGKVWTAAYVEVEEFFDWTPFRTISADVFVPEGTPLGLKAKLILTVGEDWKWTEMSRLTKLIPGEWTTITASIVPGSTDWRRTEVTDEFRADVRKLGVRIESNMRPVYAGAIYIDNIRLE